MGKALRARLVVGPRMGANGEGRATKGGDLGIEEGDFNHEWAGIFTNGEGGMGNGGGGRAVGRLGERDLGIEEGDFNHEWARIFTNGEGGMGRDN